MSNIVELFGFGKCLQDNACVTQEIDQEGEQDCMMGTETADSLSAFLSEHNHHFTSLHFTTLLCSTLRSDAMPESVICSDALTVSSDSLCPLHAADTLDISYVV